MRHTALLMPSALRGQPVKRSSGRIRPVLGAAGGWV